MRKLIAIALLVTGLAATLVRAEPGPEVQPTPIHTPIPPDLPPCGLAAQPWLVVFPDGQPGLMVTEVCESAKIEQTLCSYFWHVEDDYAFVGDFKVPWAQEDPFSFCLEVYPKRY